MNTVTQINRLWSYRVRETKSNVDPYVKEIFESRLSADTLNSLYTYTRGMYSTDLHYESFMKYSRPLAEENHYGDFINSCPLIQEATRILVDQLQCVSGLKPIKQTNFDEIRYIKKSAAGYGYIGCKGDNYYRARARATYHLKTYAKDPKNYKFIPDKAFARTQLALISNPKIRHVWGRPFHSILIEGLFAQPLIDALTKVDTPIFIGKDIHKDMPIKVIEILAHGGNTYCFDFKGFDSRVNNAFKLIAFRIIKSLFAQLDEYDENVFAYIVDNFMTTPVMMPDGKLFVVTTGVPSGSYFTQLVDSIVNVLMIYAYQLHTYNRTFITYVLGDDSLFVVPDEAHSQDRTDIASFFTRYNAVLSVDKTIITSNYLDIIFLGHNFYGSRVTRDEFTALSLALHTEDEIPDPIISILRIASLIYDSGFNSHGLLNTYKVLLDKYNIDWSNTKLRPLTIRPPFSQLFVIS